MKKLFFLTKSERIISTEETGFKVEKDLQRLTEKNLEELLGVRFVKSEHKLHDGTRIDTLGITEDRHPVIIEYKKVQSRNVVGQILSYATSLLTYRDAFELLIMKKLGRDESDKINWDSIRLICIAKEFSTHDFGYLRNSAREVELITYHYFNNDTLLFEWADPGQSLAPVRPSRPGMSNQDSSRKPSLPRKRTFKDKKLGKSDNSLDYALDASDDSLRSLYHQAVKMISRVGADVRQHPTKMILNFKRGKATFASLRPMSNLGKLRVWANLDPKRENLVDGFTRDLTNKGKWASGDLEITIGSQQDLNKAVAYCRKAFLQASE